ncbi:MAG: hypothetical protein M3R50_12635 [Bacteroidota bacterium]|nr:hypothetical protein [Bacteroidota bacterium]
MNKKLNMALISIGLFIISGTLLAQHLTKMPDILTGLLMGMGIGVMLLALLRKKLRPNC